MKKKHIIWLQILYWSFNFIGKVITPRIFYPEKNNFHIDVLRITYFLVGISTFYICYLFIIPKIFNSRKFYTAILVFLLSITCFTILRYLTEEVFLPATFGFGNYDKDTGMAFYFFDNIYNGSITVFIAAILWLLEKFGVIETEKKALELERNQAKIHALKTQINPHFIFNSLNNIYSLVYQNSDKALPAIEELGSLLRYSTKDLEKDFITLDKEIGYIDSLTALEKLRIRNPELLVIENNIGYPHLRISPMLLVPFVENAFKHGDFRNKGFEMRISDQNQILHFYLMNYKGLKIKDEGSGIGIANVKKRLELLYPQKHALDITDSETEFIVDLMIDLKDGKN
jgi:sensor histidine kinase YesM